MTEKKNNNEEVLDFSLDLEIEEFEQTQDSIAQVLDKLTGQEVDVDMEEIELDSIDQLDLTAKDSDDDVLPFTLDFGPLTEPEDVEVEEEEAPSLTHTLTESPLTDLQEPVVNGVLDFNLDLGSLTDEGVSDAEVEAAREVYVNYVSESLNGFDRYYKRLSKDMEGDKASFSNTTKGAAFKEATEALLVTKFLTVFTSNRISDYEAHRDELVLAALRNMTGRDDILDRVIALADTEVRSEMEMIDKSYDSAIKLSERQKSEENYYAHSATVRQVKTDKDVSKRRKKLEELRNTEALTVTKELMFESSDKVVIEDGAESEESSIVKKFRCGHCGHYSLTDKDFAIINMVDSRAAQNIENISLTFNPNVCSECGFMNILPEAAVHILTDYVNNEFFKSSGNKKRVVRAISEDIDTVTINPSKMKELLENVVDVSIEYYGIEEKNLDEFTRDKFIAEYDVHREAFNRRILMLENMEKYKDNPYPALIHKLSQGGSNPLNQDRYDEVVIAAIHSITQTNLFRILTDIVKDIDEARENVLRGMKLKQYLKNNVDKPLTDIDVTSLTEYVGEDIEDLKDFNRLADIKIEEYKEEVKERQAFRKVVAKRVLVPEIYKDMILPQDWGLRDVKAEDAVRYVVDVVGDTDLVIDFMEEVVNNLIDKESIKIVMSYALTNPTLKKLLVDVRTKVERAGQDYTLAVFDENVDKEYLDKLVNIPVYEKAYQVFKAFGLKNLFLIEETLTELEEIVEDRGVQHLFPNLRSLRLNIDNVKEYYVIEGYSTEPLTELSNTGFSSEEILEYFHDKDFKEYRKSNYGSRMGKESLHKFFNRTHLPGDVVRKVTEESLLEIYSTHPDIEQSALTYKYLTEYVNSEKITFLFAYTLREVFKRMTMEEIEDLTGMSLEVLAKAADNIGSFNPSIFKALTDNDDKPKFLGFKFREILFKGYVLEDAGTMKDMYLEGIKSKVIEENPKDRRQIEEVYDVESSLIPEELLEMYKDEIVRDIGEE